MTSNYEAWNGERYQWPPPDGWYLASDDRWWAPNTGPGPAEPAEPDDTATRIMGRPEGSATDTDPISRSATHTRPVPPMHRTGPHPVVEIESARSAPSAWDDGEPATGAATNSSVGAGDPWANVAVNPVDGGSVDDNNDPWAGFGTGQGSGLASFGAGDGAQSGTGSEYDPTTSYSQAAGYEGGEYDATLLEQNRTGVLSSDDSARFEPPVEMSTPPPSRGPFGVHPAVLVAGLLVLAAGAIAAFISVTGGNDGDLSTIEDPTVVDTGGESADATEANDTGAAGDSSDQEAADDMTAEDMTADDMTDESENDQAVDTESTTTTAAAEDTTATTADLTADLDAVTEFRDTLDELNITAGDLRADEIVTFGQTACGYAIGADDFDGYTEARQEALTAANNEELSAEELGMVVDSAVKAFCPEQATRLGI